MKTEQAKAAQLIRKELKTAYPQTKFSVTSGSGANTSSVNVDWEDGPTCEVIDKIINKYQYGHFDGMTDMYEHSNSREDIPQAKFVFSHRDMSERTKEHIITKHNKEFCEEGQITDLNKYNEDARCFNSEIVYRYFNKLTIEVQ